MPYSEECRILVDPDTDELVVSSWVVCVSGIQGKVRFVNIIDILPTKREAKNLAASVRRSENFKWVKLHRDLKVHVRPNYVSEWSYAVTSGKIKGPE